MSVFAISGFIYVVEILPIYRVLNILFMDVFMCWWHGYLRCMLFCRCDVLLLKFLCMSIENYLKTWCIFLEYLLYSRIFIALIEVGRYRRHIIFSSHLLGLMSIIPSLSVRPLKICGMHRKPFTKGPMKLSNQKLIPLCNNMSSFAWKMVKPSLQCKWDLLIL